MTNTNDLDWNTIDHVLLDMDGTLLDRHFDNVLFEEVLPQRYAAKHGLTFTEARDHLMAMYHTTQGTLDWADLPYWGRRLDIDVIALAKELASLVQFLPDAETFLRHLRQQGKRVSLLTNAHPVGIEIKTARTSLDQYVDRIVSAFEVGYPKTQREYWPTCRALLRFDPTRTLYVDDDEACLDAAQAFGIVHLIHCAKSSSQRPPSLSTRYRSIESLQTLIKDPRGPVQCVK